LALLLAFCASPAAAQAPFYTDDPSVTDRGKWHFEFFDEIDTLQHPQYPNLKQNTTNYKLNYGLPHNLEVDLDSPYLSIYRALGSAPQTSAGIGDTNVGIKWNYHKETADSWLPGASATFYVEFPTGDTSQELGSGLIDYWLNFIGQRHFSEKTRITGNLGILFAGNTSTGVVGIDSTRGRVYTGGISLLHDFNDKWTVGTEVYGGYTDNNGLARSQLQVMVGGIYTIRNGLALTFGVLGGRFVASPLVGGQIGFTVDMPDLWKRAPAVAP
jgi:Putative MetA-pathway of phenol degradation